MMGLVIFEIAKFWIACKTNIVPYNSTETYAKSLIMLKYNFKSSFSLVMVSKTDGLRRK